MVVHQQKINATIKKKNYSGPEGCPECTIQWVKKVADNVWNMFAYLFHKQNPLLLYNMLVLYGWKEKQNIYTHASMFKTLSTYYFYNFKFYVKIY